MNKVIVLGRIYKEGTPKETKNDGKFLGFRIMDQQKEKNKTFYFNCIAFDKQAELISTVCENGDQVFVFGKLSQQTKDKPLTLTVHEFYKVNESKQKTDEKVEEDFDF